MSDVALANSAEAIHAEAARLLAQLTRDGDLGTPVDAAYSSLVIPPWMVPHILAAPQDTLTFLDNLQRANLPHEAYVQLSRLDPHATAGAIFNSVRGRDPRDVEGNREIIAKLMMGLGIFAGLAMWIALGAAIILLKLGPIGVVLGIIALFIGLAILVVTTVIMVIITIVRTIIGSSGVEVEAALRVSGAQAAVALD